MKQINLNNFKVITDNLNTYFKSNKIMIGSSVPTEGSYSKGDIIVNNGENADKEPMWVCTESGNPGKWEVVGAGGTDLVHLKNNVIVNNAVSEVSIGIDGFNPEGDVLTVYRNSVYMIEGVDYNVQGNKIVSLKGNWNAENQSDYKFTFEVLKAVDKVNPDAVVGMENLKDDVRNAIEAAGNIDLSGYQGKTDNSLATTDKTIVGAINELFQSANNGKQLIASAIGEPISSSDTFSAMSSDINGLLSTFKTNMMNNGVTVESSDRFKQLIDKIANMAEEGSSKGIQFEMGTDTINIIDSGRETTKTVSGLKFIPTYVFCFVQGKVWHDDNKLDVGYTIRDLVFGSVGETSVDSGLGSFKVTINNNSFTIKYYLHGSTYEAVGETPFTWYAIGVGEEDTTLRDSLASILTEEGVTITEEDDMASLIGKVDSEFNNKDNKMSGIKQDLVDALIAKGVEDITYDTNWEELIGFISKFKDIVNIKFNGTQLLCGGSHAFLLKNDGTVWATGANGYGQLGLGNKTNTSTFQKVNITNVKQIVCGYNFTAILKNDGSVWTCGGNGYGQLGLNSADSNVHSTFTKVTTNINNDVVQIYAGGYHLFALKTDGTVWCCGKNDNGQLGLGSTISKNTFTQVTTNTEDVVQISCGFEHTYILKSSGKIFSCGKNDNGQLGLGSLTNMSTFNHVQSIDNVKDIISGGYHVFAVKKDGTIWACGWNKGGQLGLNDTESRALFTQVTLGVDNMKQIVCGVNNSFIIRNDGILYAAGENGNGELGMGDTTDVKLFSNVPNLSNGIVAAYAGEFFTMIIDNEGIVYTTGRNDSGQLGITGSETRKTFTVVNQLN